MVMRSTRLEFLIVTTAFVILLLCSRPPRPGSAETTGPRTSDFGSEASRSTPVAAAPAIGVESVLQTPTAQTAPAPVAIALPDTSQTPKPATKRMASVDARNCPGLNYPQVMYGEVTVRWVWDGTRFIPRKVCVVKEPGGITTVWSFDDPGGALLTEIGDVPADSQ